MCRRRKEHFGIEPTLEAEPVWAQHTTEVDEQTPRGQA